MKESPTDGEGCVTIDNKHYCIDQSIIDRYRHPNASGVPSGPPLIEGDCYGNGGVLAEDSVFAAQANLFDLEQFLGDDIQPELIGKGGDGGFVRDDCWVVPQYFEVDGLYILRSSDLTPTSSNATSTTGNTRTATQAFTGSWADGRTGLTSFLQSQHFLSVRNTIGTNLNTSLATQGYYKYFDNRYANVLADNMGHVMLWPTAIFHYQLGSRSCRTWGARYTGHGKVDINSNANARNEIMSVDDYSKGKYDDDISANREDKIIGETGHFTSPDGQIIRYRISGLTTFDAEGNRTTDNSSLLINSIFGTEIGGTDGYPGAVFITW